MPGDFTEEDMEGFTGEHVAGFTVGGIAASNITASTEEGLAITVSMGRLATMATRFTHTRPMVTHTTAPRPILTRPTAHAMPLMRTAVAWAMHLTVVTLRTEPANVSLQFLKVGSYRIERLGPCNPLSPYFST